MWPMAFWSRGVKTVILELQKKRKKTKNAVSLDLGISSFSKSIFQYLYFRMHRMMGISPVSKVNSVFKGWKVMIEKA